MKKVMIKRQDEEEISMLHTFHVENEESEQEYLEIQDR